LSWFGCYSSWGILISKLLISDYRMLASLVPAWTLYLYLTAFDWRWSTWSVKTDLVMVHYSG
jgi:hypothetical protein